MAKTNNLTDFLTDVANAIREKEGSSEAINPQDFVAKIRSIARLPGVDKVTHNELDAFLLNLANTLREVKGTSEPINPQAFSAQILSIVPVITDMKLLPLFVEAIEPLTVRFSLNPIEYSLDNYTWHTLPADTSTPTIGAGRRAYFRAIGLTATSADGIGTFSISGGKCELGGNAMSMIWGNDFRNHDEMAVDYNLKKLFFKDYSGNYNTTIINAERMIIACKTVRKNGCEAMFRCMELVKGCQLPATTLGERAYASMYQGCSNLEIGSDLPATDVTDAMYCYNGMYAFCSKLRYLKAMILTPSPNNENGYGAQTGNWLKGVASSGVFVKNSKAGWPNIRGDHGIPLGWTIETADE